MKKLLPILFLMAFFGCQKDIVPELSVPQPGIPKLPATPVTGTVAGIVLDENDQPVENAVVNIGLTTLSTDERGMFNTGTLTLDKYITTVKVSQPGYFTAYRSFSANASKNYVSIKLIPKTLTGSFTSTDAGSVTLSNGSSIAFQASSINYKNSGAAYTGTVNVYASYIDPTAADFGAAVPGSLMAEDATNFYVLRSTGMLAVEMESPSGEPLQLTPAKPATIMLAIPASLQSKAPETIDTWSLDARGIWMKEGEAVRAGSVYEFEASHFSFWNCDVPMSAVYLTINVKDNNGNNLSGQYVTLTSSTTFGTSYAITDTFGMASGMVPANEVLSLNISNYYMMCGTPYHTQNIGPYSSNASVNVVATPLSSETYTISGTALNCGGTDLVNGFVEIYYNNYFPQYAPVVNGAFSATIFSCQPITTIDVIVGDHDSQQQSSTISIPVSGNTLNTGVLTACGTSSNEFINYSLDGTPFTMSSATSGTELFATVSATTTYISGFNQMNNTRISFGVLGAAPGTFNVNTVDTMLINNLVNAVPQAGSIVEFQLFGNVGQYIEGDFNIMLNASGTPHTLTGSFRLRRN